MTPLLYRIGKHGLIAGGVLAGGVFVAAYLLQRGMSAQGIEPASANAPLKAALVFGLIGFGLAAVLEMIAFGWRKLRGQRQPWEPAPEPKEAPT